MSKVTIKSILLNIFVAILLIGAHVLALFSAPPFLGTNYSKRSLLDSYCSSNLVGSSVVFNASAESSNDNLQKINKYKDEYDIEFNSILGLSVDDATCNDIPCGFVGAEPSKTNNHYNNFRAYSIDNWNTLNDGNYIFITETLAFRLVPSGENPKNYRTILRDKTIEIKISNKVYPFKIGGYYSNSMEYDGWRARGKYFDETFTNCVFVSDSFISDKFTNVFQMITSDTFESGETFDRYESLVKSIGGNILTPKNTNESELLNKVNALNTKNHSVIQPLIIVISIVGLLSILVLSICMFNLNSGLGRINKWIPLIWSAVYLLLSYAFVFLTKNMIITIFDFTAPGANKFSLSIISIYSFVLICGLLIKAFWKKDKKKNRIVHYNV